jgi:hypothetical protein
MRRDTCAILSDGSLTAGAARPASMTLSAPPAAVRRDADMVSGTRPGDTISAVGQRGDIGQFPRK